MTYPLAGRRDEYFSEAILQPSISQISEFCSIRAGAVEQQLGTGAEAGIMFFVEQPKMIKELREGISTSRLTKEKQKDALNRTFCCNWPSLKEFEIRPI